MALNALIDFAGAGPAGSRLQHAFGDPIVVLEARTAAQVLTVLDEAQDHAGQGRWCVGFVRFEAAPAFDAALQVHEADGPLAWFAVYESAGPWPVQEHGTYAPMQWRSLIEREAFDAQIARIHQAIADGEVYQINLTAPLASGFSGDAEALFHALHRAQPDGYAAFISTDHGEQILSVSPELFFDWRDGRLLARPMKGTAPRGATPEDDAAQSERLLASEKERAENLMIVDLIRNDLSRVAQPFSVQVPRLFERRAWPTVWQMTSDVTARSRPGVGLADVFGALFPCGSVTGAPKVSAMRWIRRLEDGPRGVYCGAIGVLQPGGAATFSVAIRTVVRRGAQARCGIGSGITADAVAADEWREWQHKRAFLERAAEPFDLLQTLRLEEGGFPALGDHLQRLAAAGRHFGYRVDEPALRAALHSVAAQHPAGRWRVRLLSDALGRPTTLAFPLPDTALPVAVQLADRPIDAPADFLRHKTTRRGHYDAFAPADPGCFDTLLWNVAGELTEFTRGNLFAQLADGRWVTPPLACGLLDGVGRARALREGRVSEQVLRLADLPSLRSLMFVNALRGELPARLCDGASAAA